MSLVTPDFGLLFWMLVSFLILVFLLKKFAWKTILKMMKDREDSINDALNQAEKAKEQIKSLNEENEKILKEAKIERDNLIKQAKETAEKIVLKAQEDAKIQAEKIIENAKVEIEAQKENAISELSAKVGELSVEIAQKVLEKELSDPQNQQDYVNSLIKNISLN